MTGGAGGGDHGFNPRLIAAVVAIGVVAFIALWALIALGPQLASGNDGGGHALSKAAPGYAGIVDLTERAGAEVELRRRIEEASYDDYEPLLVLTPMHRTRAPAIAELLGAQRRLPALIVLPKWRTMAIPGQAPKPGWVGAGFPVRPPAAMLPPTYFGQVTIKTASTRAQLVSARLGARALAVHLPRNVQTIAGDDLETLIAAPGGDAVLAQVSGRDIYILADPDLINNFAFASRERAAAGAMLIDALADYADADGLAFDVTLNGLGAQRSLLRFAFVPPFIGITLCLIAAGLFALWQAWARFGPAIRPGRPIPVSKAALIANSADLIKQAHRELDGAAAYVKNQRSAIARRLHAPAGLDDDATDAWIDRHLREGGEAFSALARRLPLARSTHEFLADAQALHAIRKDLLRDS